MRAVRLFTFVVLTSVRAAAQLPYLPAPAPYLEPQFLAAANAAPNVVVAGNEEPGERLVVTGQVMDDDRPVAGASVYVFHTDVEGRYTKDGSADGELNPRLHGAMRTDATGRYEYETIRPGSYNNNAAHVHYVVRAPGYKAQLLDLWFQDDPILAARRKAGLPEVPPAIVKEAVAIRPITRDATGVWHATRDIAMYRDN
jgi:protocatechuate 3,4-dioxygenase beta subunit